MFTEVKGLLYWVWTVSFNMCLFKFLFVCLSMGLAGCLSDHLKICICHCLFTSPRGCLPLINLFAFHPIWLYACITVWPAVDHCVCLSDCLFVSLSHYTLASLYACLLITSYARLSAELACSLFAVCVSASAIFCISATVTAYWPTQLLRCMSVHLSVWLYLLQYSLWIELQLLTNLINISSLK